MAPCRVAPPIQRVVAGFCQAIKIGQLNLREACKKPVLVRDGQFLSAAKHQTNAVQVGKPRLVNQRTQERGDDLQNRDSLLSYDPDQFFRNLMCAG